MVVPYITQSTRYSGASGVDTVWVFSCLVRRVSFNSSFSVFSFGFRSCDTSEGEFDVWKVNARLGGTSSQTRDRREAPNLTCVTERGAPLLRSTVRVISPARCVAESGSHPAVLGLCGRKCLVPLSCRWLYESRHRAPRPRSAGECSERKFIHSSLFITS
jgi:hypothetical protein